MLPASKIVDHLTTSCFHIVRRVHATVTPRCVVVLDYDCSCNGIGMATNATHVNVQTFALHIARLVFVAEKHSVGIYAVENFVKCLRRRICLQWHKGKFVDRIRLLFKGVVSKQQFAATAVANGVQRELRNRYSLFLRKRCKNLLLVFGRDVRKIAHRRLANGKVSVVVANQAGHVIARKQQFQALARIWSNVHNIASVNDFVTMLTV